MIDLTTLKQLTLQIQELLPNGIRELGDDMENKIRQVLQNQLTRMNLVSCEEFDLHIRMLLRNEEKLSQLEHRLNALETMLKNDSVVSPSASSGRDIADRGCKER